MCSDPSVVMEPVSPTPPLAPAAPAPLASAAAAAVSARGREGAGAAWPKDGWRDSDGLCDGRGGDSSRVGGGLVSVAEALAADGFLVYRYDLPFRRNKIKGPPTPAVAVGDRRGIAEAVGLMRGMVRGKVWAGGHSYGGRQSCMAAAEDVALVDGLLLLSYPLHPPNASEKLRTAHFPQLRTPALFVHGTKDPFGSEAEMTEALKMIPAAVELMMVAGAGHDLGRKMEALTAAVAVRVRMLLLQ